MSHQTGISATDELRDAISRSKTGNIRIMKIGIQNEHLVLEHSVPATGNFQEDWDALVLPCLDADRPCFILYRLDSGRNTGYDWVYIAYTPESSPIRQKMMYAATSMTVKKLFGAGNIKTELSGNVPADVDLNGYMQHLRSLDAPKPLSHAELELQKIRQNEMEMSKQSQRQTIRSAGFPLSQPAVSSLHDLKSGKINYVQLSLDIANEVVNLEMAEAVDVHDMHTRVPPDHPRYHLFNFRHVYHGAHLTSTVFISSVPGSKCSIKERMLYSTCRGPVLDFSQHQVGLVIAKKIETDDPSELTPEFLMEQLHP